MAAEIQITAGISVRKGNLSFEVPSTTYSVDMTGTGGPTPGFISVGTTEESTSFSELTTEGFFRFGFSMYFFMDRWEGSTKQSQFEGTTPDLQAKHIPCLAFWPLGAYTVCVFRKLNNTIHLLTL